MRTLCVVTTSRADYGLLRALMEGIAAEPGLRLQLIATGAHLSPEFGMTVREIEGDGFQVDGKVEILLSADSPGAIGKSVGLGLISFSDAFQRLKPDLLVGLGDRFELFAAVGAALFAGIPIAHLHGGEVTEGAVDDALRHAITKMSHLHFTAAEPYARRVVQLGEDPARVFTVGAFALDALERLPRMDRGALESSLGFRFRSRNLLITFHPPTLSPGAAEAQLEELLAALDLFPGLGLVFTHPNADPEGRALSRRIQAFVDARPERAIASFNLGQTRYLSLMREVDAVVGNSSSGILEAPSTGTPTVNIGDRQRGRLRAPSVVDCEPTREAIGAALQRVLDPGFRIGLGGMQSPFGTPGAAARTLAVLRDHPLDGLTRKRWHPPVETT